MQLDLLGGMPEPPPEPSRRARIRMRSGWEPINHACRNCGGRLLQKFGVDGGSVLRCPQCESTAKGDPDALCCCGEEVDGVGRVWECFRNPKPTKANPQVVLVRERPIVRDNAKNNGRVRTTVGIKDY